MSEFKKPDHVIQKAVTAVEKELKEKIKEVTKEEAPEKLEIVGYRSNIVLGYMYFAKVKIGTYPLSLLQNHRTSHVTLKVPY